MVYSKHASNTRTSSKGIHACTHPSYITQGCFVFFKKYGRAKNACRTRDAFYKKRFSRNTCKNSTTIFATNTPISTSRSEYYYRYKRHRNAYAQKSTNSQRIITHLNKTKHIRTQTHCEFSYTPRIHT